MRSHMNLRIAMVALISNVALSGRAGVTGQWDFDAGDLRATIGTPLTYLDGPGGATAQGTRFDTTDTFGIPGIGGVPARVMQFPKMGLGIMGYVLSHGAAANGEGV